MYHLIEGKLLQMVGIAYAFSRLNRANLPLTQNRGNSFLDPYFPSLHSYFRRPQKDLLLARRDV